MKKTLVSFALLLTFTTVSKAQFDIRYGLNAGFNTTTIKVATPFGGSKYNGGSYAGGGFAEFAFGDHFVAQGGINISSRGVTDYGITDLEIPIFAEWKSGEGHGFLIYAGPYFDFVVATSGGVIVGKTNSYEKIGINPFDLGVKGGIGYQSRSGIIFKVGYELGLTNVASTNKNGNKVSYDGVIVNLGYMFHGRNRNKFY